MRSLTEASNLKKFLTELGRATQEPARIYLVGGASAVLLGWRQTTIDIDLEIVPDRDDLLLAIRTLKEKLQINVELASPSHFIPALPGWQDRSVYIGQEGPLSIYHYDFYSQALAKIERGHEQDRLDVEEMLARGLVEPARLRSLYTAISEQLYRYPAVDPRSFDRELERALSDTGAGGVSPST